MYAVTKCSSNLYCTTRWCANMYFMPVTQRQAALLLIWGVALRDVTNNSCVRDYFDPLYSLLLTMSSFFFVIA